MTADRARGALAVLQDADGKFICKVPCGYIVEQTASAHKPRRIQAQRRRRATLLYNYKKLAALVADEEAYCEVEYHAGRKTFSTTPQAKGFIQRKTEAEIVEEMREEKQKQFKETKSGFDSLTRAISLFEGHKEFVVIRLYYFGEDINGDPREGGTATWEEIAEELSDAGILKEIKTARRWRNKIVNDMAVCVFGIPAAVSAATYRKAVDK